MSLSTHPDLCLLKVFHRVPVYDLLTTVPLVCHRWSALQPTACQQRKSLTILDCPHQKIYPIRDYQYYRVYNQLINQENGSKLFDLKTQNSFTVVKEILNFEFCYKMTQRMPQISNLHFRYTKRTNVAQIEKVILMLSELSGNLVCLRLNFNLKSDQHHQYSAEELNCCFGALCEAMSSLAKLKILYFEISLNKRQREAIKLAHLISLSTVSQLSLLRYKFPSVPKASDQNVPKLLKMLNEHVDAAPQAIMYAHHVRVRGMLLLDERLAKRFTRLTILLKTHHLDEFDTFCSRFVSLTILILRIDSTIPFARVGKSVRKLGQLLDLTLIVSTVRQAIGGDTPENPSIPPLTSVKVLTIEIATQSHGQHVPLLLNVVSMCPNVQIITWNQWLRGCTQCGYNINDKPNEMSTSPIYYLVPQAQFDHCIRQTLRPLLHNCEVLHKIVLSFNQNVEFSKGKANLMLEFESKKKFIERFWV